MASDREFCGRIDGRHSTARTRLQRWLSGQVRNKIFRKLGDTNDGGRRSSSLGARGYSEDPRDDPGVGGVGTSLNMMKELFVRLLQDCTRVRHCEGSAMIL